MNNSNNLCDDMMYPSQFGFEQNMNCVDDQHQLNIYTSNSETDNQHLSYYWSQPQQQQSYNWSSASAVVDDSSADIESARKPVTIRKRSRITYTTHQLAALEKQFAENKYLTRQKHIELAINLELTERQVIVWFRNRRTKQKKIKKYKIHQRSVTPPPADDFYNLMVQRMI